MKNEWSITPDMFGHYRVGRNQGDVKHESAIFLRFHEIDNLIKELKQFKKERGVR